MSLRGQFSLLCRCAPPLLVALSRWRLNARRQGCMAFVSKTLLWLWRPNVMVPKARLSQD